MGTCMLPSQRALFDIPRDVCFLNAASWSPLPLAVQEAGRAAVGRKGQPWKLESNFQSQQYERARKAAAALIGADQGGGGLARALVLLGLEIAFQLPRLALAPNGGAAGLLHSERQGTPGSGVQETDVARDVEQRALTRKHANLRHREERRLARRAAVMPDNFSGLP